jgi:hypothetical protein
MSHPSYVILHLTCKTPSTIRKEKIRFVWVLVSHASNPRGRHTWNFGYMAANVSIIQKNECVTTTTYIKCPSYVILHLTLLARYVKKRFGFVWVLVGHASNPRWPSHVKLWLHGSERVHYTKEMMCYNYNVHKVLFGYMKLARKKRGISETCALYMCLFSCSCRMRLSSLYLLEIRRWCPCLNEQLVHNFIFIYLIQIGKFFPTRRE